MGGRWEEQRGGVGAEKKGKEGKGNGEKGSGFQEK